MCDCKSEMEGLHLQVSRFTKVPPRRNGWTLPELMVVVLVTSTLLSIAVPVFSDVLAQNRLATTTNSLLSALIAARQTAISRNVPVTFCAGNPTDGCHGQWSTQEWMIFTDIDRNGLIDTVDTLKIADQPPSPGSLEISGNGPFKKAVVFQPSGLAETLTGAFAAGRLRVCVPRAIKTNAIDLVLIGSGRAEPEHHDYSGVCPPAGAGS